MEHWLTLTPWPGLLIWTLIYLSDYWLTIKVARLYRSSPHFGFEGSLELTRQFEQDVDALKPVSRRHILMLIVTNLILSIVWGLFALLGYTSGFAFFLGMFILLEVGVHLRHFHSYFILVQSQSKDGLAGNLYHRRWFIFATSAFEFLSLAILFLFTALITGSLFFTGGALACLSLASNHFRRSRKLYQQASASPSAEIKNE